MIQNQQLLDKFSFQFAPNSLTMITAPSGTGKTALLQALAGFEPLSQGEVLLNQIPLTTLDDTSRHAAILLIPQQGGILPTSVRDNLKLVNATANDKTLTAALAGANLTVNLETNATLLSDGERQRLAIAPNLNARELAKEAFDVVIFFTKIGFLAISLTTAFKAS